MKQTFMDYVRDFDYNDPEYYSKPEYYLENYIEEIDYDEIDCITEDFNSHIYAIIA